MPRKPNYNFAKRQKELAKQQRKAEKREQKRLKKEADQTEGVDPDRNSPSPED